MHHPTTIIKIMIIGFIMGFVQNRAGANQEVRVPPALAMKKTEPKQQGQRNKTDVVLKEPHDVICSLKGNYQVSGTVMLPGVFLLVLYDARHAQHTVYLIPTRVVMAGLLFADMIILNGSSRVRMSDMFGFDPAPGRKVERMSTRRLSGLESGQQFHMYYNPQVTNEVEVIKVDAAQDYNLTHTRFTLKKVEMTQVHVLDADGRGILLYQCRPMLRRSIGWCAKDIQWREGVLWPTTRSPGFLIGEKVKTKGENVTLVWTPLGPSCNQSKKSRKSWTPVQWSHVQGFILDETVIIIADGQVYKYHDPQLNIQHCGTDVVKFRAKRMPIGRFLSCGCLSCHWPRALANRIGGSNASNNGPRDSQAAQFHARIHARFIIINVLIGAIVFVSGVMLVALGIYAVVLYCKRKASKDQDQESSTDGDEKTSGDSNASSVKSSGSSRSSSSSSDTSHKPSASKSSKSSSVTSKT